MKKKQQTLEEIKQAKYEIQKKIFELNNQLLDLMYEEMQKTQEQKDE